MDEVTLAFTGDVMLGRRANEVLRGARPEHPWGDVLPLLRGADATLVNLECCVTRHEARADPEKPFHFKSDPEHASSLAAAGIDYASLANNHVLDFGREGLRETLATLDERGIAHAGAGLDGEAAARPARLDVRGLRLAVLSLSDHPDHWAAQEGRPGIWHTEVSLDERVLEPLREAVREARRDADLVVLSIHWGPNMRPWPSDVFVSFARELSDAGVDVFHGHSAHVFQPVEARRGRLLLYDCGDFVDDYAVDPGLRNDWALLHRVVVDRAEKRLARLELVPCLIDPWRCQVNVAEGAEWESIAARAARLLERMGTRFEARGGRLVVEL